MTEFQSSHMVMTLQRIKALVNEGKITLKESGGLFQKAKAASASGMTDTEFEKWLNFQPSENPAVLPKSQSHARQMYQAFSESMIDRYLQHAQANGTRKFKMFI